MAKLMPGATLESHTHSTKDGPYIMTGGCNSSQNKGITRAAFRFCTRQTRSQLLVKDAWLGFRIDWMLTW